MKEDKAYPPVLYTVWQDAWIAITAPRQYLRWAFQPVWRSVRYLLFLQFVFTIIVSISLYFQTQPMFDNVQAWAQENLPLITYEDGKLRVDEDETILFTDSDAFFFKLDTTQKLEDEPRVDVFYESGVLFVEDGIVASQLGEYQEYEYSTLKLPNFVLSKETFPTWRKQIELVLVTIVPIFIFLSLAVSRLFTAAVFSGLAWLFSGFKLAYKPVYNLAIYAMTPAMLIGYLASLLFGVSSAFTFIFVLYFLIAVNFLKKFTGLRKINS